MSVNKMRPGRAVQWDISIKRSFGFSKGHIHIGVSCEATANGKSEKPVAVIESEVVSSYRIDDEHPEIASSEAIRFGNEVGIKDAFPYLRQSVDLLATQVGLPPVKINYPEHVHAMDSEAADR